MSGAEMLANDKPDYAYGNKGEMWVGHMAADEFGELADSSHLVQLFAGREWEAGLLPFGSPEYHDAYIEKLVEIADNLRLIEDPTTGKTFEITIANEDALKEGNDVIVQISTSNSTIPDNPSNAVELAQNALVNPDKAIIYVASPGNGGSAALTPDELEIATKTGRLVDGGIRDDGWFEAFPTIQAMARALGTLDGKLTHLSADASGAHYASALMTALPKGQVEKAFLYNPTNISDLSIVSYWSRMLKEIYDQRKYAEVTHDLLAVTGVRREAAAKILGEDFGTKATQLRSGTFGPRKMRNEAQIYRRGPKNGNAAHLHISTGLWHQPDAKVTYVFPEFSAHYKSREDIYRFMQSVYHIGGLLTGSGSIEGNAIPVGQYWHGHHPLARLALQDDAFNR